jgi:WD40 repeat protein
MKRTHWTLFAVIIVCLAPSIVWAQWPSQLNPRPGQPAMPPFHGGIGFDGRMNVPTGLGLPPPVVPNFRDQESWSHDGKRLAVAGEDEAIKIWDVDAQPAQELHALPGQAQAEARENHNVVCTVAWRPDGRRLASACPSGAFRLWDTVTWQEVLTLRPGPAGPFAKELLPSHAGTLAWSPDGRQLAFFSGGGNVSIWDATPEEGALGRQKVETTK